MSLLIVESDSPSPPHCILGARVPPVEFPLVALPGFAMALTSFADGAIFGRRYGGGEPEVVALHGWGRRSDDFARLLSGLDGLAIDLPGFGASPSPPERMGAAGYARAVLPVFRSLSRAPIVIGHSFGGRVAVCLAAEHPELVRGLILTGVPLLHRTDRSRPPWSFRLLRTAHRLRLIPDARMEEIRRRRGSADYRAASGVMREVLVTVVNESYEKELASLRVPVRLVWGTEDQDAPLEMARRAAEIMRNAGVDVRLEEVPGAGHFVPVEQSDRILSMLADWP
jgi:pimeloyl-ACP methyl ester carboxylesterase